MAFKVDVPYRNTIDSSKNQAQTFQFLADLENSIPIHFPGLDSFTKEAELTYHWKFQEVKYGGHQIQIEVLTKFELKSPSHIKMVSVPKPGFSSLRGHWNVEPSGSASRITFEVDLQTELPLPFFLKAMAAPLTQKEITKIFDWYLANVGKALS
jgi:carbon monoxide dehydrogenase subunit G